MPPHHANFQEIACSMCLSVGLYGLVLGTFFFTLGSKGEEKVIDTQARILTDGLVTPLMAVMLGALDDKTYLKQKSLLEKIKNFSPSPPIEKKKSKKAKKLEMYAFLMFAAIAAVGIGLSYVFYYFSDRLWFDGWKIAPKAMRTAGAVKRFSYWHCWVSAAILLAFVFVIQCSMTFLWIARFSEVSIPATISYILEGFR